MEEAAPDVYAIYVHIYIHIYICIHTYIYIYTYICIGAHLAGGNWNHYTHRFRIMFLVEVNGILFCLLTCFCFKIKLNSTFAIKRIERKVAYN